MLLHIGEFSGEPPHRQISEQLLDRILAGDLVQGTALQSPQKFARTQRLSVNTVMRAYDDLARKGLITRSGGEICVNSLSPAQKQALSLQRKLADAEENRRLEHELITARKIQFGLLPAMLPFNDRLQVAAHFEPSHIVSGDFYDCIPIDEHRFGFVIADACGKGLPAALLISQIQAILKSEVRHGLSIYETISNLDHHVKCYAAANQFVTLFYGIFDRNSGELEYANAGHNHPLLARNDGRIEFLKTTGPALGIKSPCNYQIQAARLNSGDHLLFYTDGVTETMNATREEFGDQRLSASLINQRRRDAREIVRCIVEELSSFQSSFAQDDRTLLLLKLPGE